MTETRSQRAEGAVRNGGGGKLRRSGIFVVPRPEKSISPVGAACSESFTDDVAPGRSLDSLWVCDSTNMSALTGLAPCPAISLCLCALVVHPSRIADPQPQYRLCQPMLGQVRLSQVEKIKNIYRRYRSQRLRHLRFLRGLPVKQFAFKASKGHSSLLKAIKAYSRVSGKKIIFMFLHEFHEWTRKGILVCLRPIPTYWDLFRPPSPLSVASVSFRQSRRSLGEGRCSKQPKSRDALYRNANLQPIIAYFNQL